MNSSIVADDILITIQLLRCDDPPALAAIQKFLPTISKKKKEITGLMAQELFHLLSHFLTPLILLLLLLILQPPDSDPTPFHRSAIPRDKFVEITVVKVLADAESRTRAHW